MMATIAIILLVGVVVFIIIRTAIIRNHEENNYTPSTTKTVSNNDLNKSIPTNKENKPRTRKTSGITKGKFEVTGYHYLSDEIKKIVWKQVKVGDKIKLVPDPTNQHSSSAVKVIWNDIQIGWYAERGYRQEEVFNALLAGKEIEGTILKNVRGQDNYYRNGRIESNGQTQFIDVEFRYQK